MLAVTKPVYPKTTAVDLCRKQREEQQIAKLNPEQPHPYKQVLARYTFNKFDNAEMILLCHTNSLTQLEFFNFKVELHRKYIKSSNPFTYNREILRMALTNTRFEPMLPVLCDSVHSCLVFSKQWNVADVLKITKRTPKILVLCGVLGDRFLQRSELEHVATLPDKETILAQFAATLDSVGNQLVNNLQSHQSNLCQLLDARADALKTPTSPVIEETK